MSEAYNFTNSGSGSYSIEANNLFYLVQDDNRVTPLYATSEALTASLSGNLVVARNTHVQSDSSKKAKFVGCTAARQIILNDAATAAQSYAASALS